jgi:predicted MFS family arabinose efflux permease
MRNWKQYPSLVLAGLLVLHVLAHIDRSMLVGFSPQIIPDLSLSNTQYGFLTGVVWVLSFGFMAIFLGSLADRFSRTRVIAFGVLVWSVCTAASGSARSFEQMALARFFVATGEAALVPAAVSLLAEVFPPARRGAATGIFFIGIPLGLGLSFVIAGWLGDSLGWRGTYKLLGLIGSALMVPLLLLPDRAGEAARSGSDRKRGAPFLQQLRDLWSMMRVTPALRHTIVGFILVHFAFAAVSFLQLWLVQERGYAAADIARKLGLLQILFGTLGSVVGGLAGDWLARRFTGGHATVLMLMVLVCVPLMIAAVFVPTGTAVFFIGLCAGFFLLLASYGPAMALLQAFSPRHMWATTTGLTMLGINVFAIAMGNLAAGAASDHLRAIGVDAPLTKVLLGLYVLVGLSLPFFWRASRCGDERLSAARDTSVVAH